MEDDGFGRFYTDLGIENYESDPITYLISMYLEDDWSGIWTQEQFTKGS
jgi:hypothetical protein